MAVTKVTYTATATWTASTLADAFRDAFIGAGLMAAWHDSFLNTVENRVLRVVYDPAKTYGTVYYWFMFTTGGVFIQTALDWNTTTKVPQGTQYLDYYATTTNATTNHRQIISLSTATSVTVTRYTSAINTGATWFLIRNGTTNQAFSIPTPTWGPSVFVDLNKIAYNSIIFSDSSVTNIFACSMLFYHGSCHLRRTFLGGEALRGTTTLANFTNTTYLTRYLGLGNGAGGNNLPTGNTTTGIHLPTAAVNTQSGLAADHRPVFTAPSITPYQAALPSDFGIVSYYASNLMAVQDTFVVNAGVEEWEMLAVTTNATGADAAKLMFLARTV